MISFFWGGLTRHDNKDWLKMKYLLDLMLELLQICLFGHGLYLIGTDIG